MAGNFSIASWKQDHGGQLRRCRCLSMPMTQLCRRQFTELGLFRYNFDTVPHDGKRFALLKARAQQASCGEQGQLRLQFLRRLRQ